MSDGLLEFMKRATDPQRELLINLSETSQKVIKLNNEIKDNYDVDNTNTTTEITSDKVKDKQGVAYMTSIQLKNQRHAERQQMKLYITDAISMGMGHLNLIQQYHKTYFEKPLVNYKKS